MYFASGGIVKIIVLVKEVPDTYGDRRLNLETGLADREASDRVNDEIGERALEVALSYAESDPEAEVTIVSMGPEVTTASIRKGLALGATKAVHITDESLVGADLSITAKVLAGAIKQAGFDLVVAGNVSTDGSGGVLPAMVAEHLEVPHLTALSSVQVSDSTVSGTRNTSYGKAQISAPLPAVISITEALPDARFPNFKGIMAAKKKPVESVTPADLGVNLDPTGAPQAIMTTVNQKPPREAGVKILDEGDAGEQLAVFLLQNRLA